MRSFVVDALKDSFSILLTLFKILVPMIVLIKALEMAGLVEILGRILEPVMVLVGVPGAMGPMPAATAEPAPPDEPPGVRDASRGFLVSPWIRLVVNQR